MTTPHQGAPDGAVTVGGKSWNYGQSVTEKAAAEVFNIEAPSNLAEALDLLPIVLDLLPEDSMKPWQKWLNLTDEDRKTGAIKQAIIDSLSKNRLTQNGEDTQGIIDGIDGSVNGGSPTNRPLETVKDNLQNAWSNFWDGLKGTTGGAGKLPSDVKSAAAELNAATTTASTNATAAGNSAAAATELAVDVTEAGSNLIKNSSFEKGLFSQGAGTYSTEQARTGSRSLKILSTGAAKTFTFLSDDSALKYIPVTGLDTFYLEVWVYGKSTNTQTTGGAGGIVMKVEPFYGLSALADQTITLTASTALNGVWTKLSGYVQVPLTASRMRVSLAFTSAVTSGSVYYFDDAIAREVTLANTANTTATSANSTANTAQTNATAAQTAASTADGKAVDLGSRVDTYISGSAANLVTNPGFEDTTQFAYNGVYQTSVKRSGSRSMSLTGDGTNLRYIELSTNKTGRIAQASGVNRVYSVNFWVYGDPANTYSSATYNIQLGLLLYDAAGAYLNAAPTVSTNSQTVGTGTWVNVAGKITTTTANTSTIRPMIYISNTVPAGNTYYFDDVQIVDITESQGVVDNIDQAVNGGSATNRPLVTVRDNLRLAWANLWDGMAGTSGATDKLPSDVKVRAASLNTTATTASTNATNAGVSALKARQIAVGRMAGGPNLIPDPSFENSADLYDASKISTEQARTGTKSIKIVADGVGWPSYPLTRTDNGNSNMAVSPGDVFYMEYWVYGKSTNTFTSATAIGRMELAVYNAAGTGFNWLRVSFNPSTTLNGVWTKYSGYVTIPAGAAYVQPYVLLDPNTPAGETYYFDDVVLKEFTQTQSVIDNMHQSINGGSSTGNGLGTIKTNLQLAWANLWDGHSGTSGSTVKLPSDVRTAAAGVKSKADTADTAAAAATTNLQTTVDSIVQAVDGGTATGAAPAAAKTKLQLAWARIFDGLYGNALGTNTSKAATDMHTAAAAVRSATTTAQTTATNANTAASTADGKAVAAQTVAQEILKSGSNLVSNPGFENTAAVLYTGDGGSYSTDFARTGTRSVKILSNGTQNRAVYLFNDGVTSSIVRMPCLPGDVFYVEAWVRGAAANTATTGSIYIGAEFNVGTTAAPSYTYFSVGTASPATIGTTSWYKVSGYLTAPANSIAFHPYLLVGSNVATGNTYYWDDVVVREVTLASTANAAASTAQTTANSATTAASTAQTAVNETTSRLDNVTLAGSGNLCTNPGFEDTTQWLLDGTSVTSPVRTGSRSVKITATGAQKYVSLVTRKTDALFPPGGPSRSYYVECWVYGDVANTYTGANNTVGIGVWGYTAAGAYVSASAGAVYLTATQVGTGSWVKLSGTVTLSSNATIAKIQPNLFVNTNVPAGNAYYVDDVIVRDVTEAVAADGKAQGAVDVFVQAVDNSTATGATSATAKAKLQLAWANLWDGMRGTSGATVKTPAEVRTEAAALKSKADTTDSSLTATNNNHSTLVDHVNNAFRGDGTLTNTSLPSALEAMQSTFKDLAANTKAIQALQSSKAAVASRGATYSVDFSDFSTMTLAGFTVSYTGSGTSTIGINSGVAQWTVNDSLSRDAKIIHSTATDTDFQSVRGTMTAPPQVPNGTTPYFYAIARVSPDGLSYVWARAYAQSLGVYKADIGYTVAGVETVWASNIALTWSLDMRFVAGIGTNARQYQIWSGNTVVYTYNESGTSSRLCSNAAHTAPSMHDTACTKYRQWGAIAQVRNSKVAGKVSATTVTDNGTPTVNGSTARMSRNSTTVVSYAAGENVASTLFDNIDYESLDVDADTATGIFTVQESKSYLISGRVKVNTSVAAWGALILQVYDSSEGIWGSSTIAPWNGSTGWKGLTTNPAAQWGDSCSLSSGGMSLHASWVQYLNAGDKVRLATYRSTGTSNELVGSSLGRETYFTIASAEGGG